MADLPISGLPAITVVSSDYLLAAVSESVTAQMTVKQVGDAYSSSLSLFPYVGDAEITGSLSVSGSTAVTGSSTIVGGLTINNFTAFGEPTSLQFKTYHEDNTTNGAWYSWRPEFLQMGAINNGAEGTFNIAIIPADDFTGDTPVDRPSLLFNADSQIYLNGSKNFRIYSPSTGKTFTVGNMATVLSGSLTVSGSVTQNNVISSLVKADSNGMLTAATGGVDYTVPAYLSAYHTASLTVPVANTPCTTSFSTTEFSGGGITISGSFNDKIKVANTGVYNIQFSAQVDKTNSSNANVFFWLSQNGTDIPWTNTDLAVFGGANEAVVAAWNFFVSASANDYFQLQFGATSDNIVLEAATPALGPQIPSLILTVNKVA